MEKCEEVLILEQDTLGEERACNTETGIVPSRTSMIGLQGSVLYGPCAGVHVTVVGVVREHCGRALYSRSNT